MPLNWQALHQLPWFSNISRHGAASVQQQNLGSDYVEKRNSLVDAVTLDQVKGQARRLLHPDRLVVTVVGKPQGVK